MDAWISLQRWKTLHFPLHVLYGQVYETVLVQVLDYKNFNAYGLR